MILKTLKFEKCWSEEGRFLRMKRGEKIMKNAEGSIRGRAKTMRTRSGGSLTAISEQDYRETGSKAVF